jgi:phosphoserine phosphatase
MSRRPLVAVDLDGTLVKGNTLHIYFRCAMTEMLLRGRIGAFACSAGLLALRRLNLVSHSSMKFGIFSRIRPTEGLRRRFVASVGKLMRSDVAALIESYRAQGYAVLLATAAPAPYIRDIWEGRYVATDMNPVTNPRRVECRGKEKLRRVEDYARSYGFRLAAAVSDDTEDDAPLLAAAPEAYLAVAEGLERLSRGK